jgi:L-alanine-DL-glutamate epimerase-like enolase superfamily enzyme
MKLRLSHKAFDLPLAHAFTISRYTVNIQKTVIVQITDGDVTGYGEATANPYYDSTVQKMAASIARVAPVVEQSGLIHPSELWQKLEPHLRDDYFALCAIDVAYWDFYARKQQKPLRTFFSASGEVPITSYTIGLATIKEMQRKIHEMPWPLYKIKLGTDHDLEIVKSLREITGSVFRVDANAAWTAEQAIRMSRELAALNVEFIEQPLAHAHLSQMEEVKAKSALPLIADESCQRREDVSRCQDFHGINIKLMKCGGITPALKMIAEARALGLKVMAGCMTESSVGISALCQLAPMLDFLDADGALLLAKDIATGVTFHDGKIGWANGYGTGVYLH